MAEGRATKRDSSLQEFTGIGIDPGKNYFQVHALESDDGHAATRKFGRHVMRKFFAETKPCLVGREACGSAYYWARELLAMGHEVRLIPPIYVKPFSKSGIPDLPVSPMSSAGQERRRRRRRDRAAAMSRRAMRFVPVKSEEQQATLMPHKTRELPVKQRTISVNALRGRLLEFGMIAAKGIGRVGELIEKAESDACFWCKSWDLINRTVSDFAIHPTARIIGEADSILSRTRAKRASERTPVAGGGLWLAPAKPVP